MVDDAFVTKREIVGTATMVYADQYGMFSIYGVTDNQVDRQQALGRGDTLDKAVAAARGELNKRRVEVDLPFITTRGQAGVALKRHGKNSTIMARINGKSEQLDIKTRVFKEGTSADVIKEYIETQEEQSQRYRRLREIENQHTAQLYALLDAAVAAKLGDS